MDHEDYDDLLEKTNSILCKLLDKPGIQPFKRKNKACGNSTPTMYGFGKSKRHCEQYSAVRDNQQEFSQLQPIISFLEKFFMKIGKEYIFNDVKSYYSHVFNMDHYKSNWKDTVLFMDIFCHGVYTLNFSASTHIDKDKSFTISCGFWKFPETGGHIYFPECGYYFSVKNGDILIFNGNRKHGSVLPTTNNGSPKLTIALFN